MKKIGPNISKLEGRSGSNKKNNLMPLLYHLIGEDSRGVCTLGMTGHSKWGGAPDLCGPWNAKEQGVQQMLLNLRLICLELNLLTAPIN